MAGRSINVIKAFNLLLNETEAALAGVSTNFLQFAIGRHDNVAEVIADHPQVKAHCGSESQLGTVLSGAATPIVGMVPESELRAARAEAADLGNQVEMLQGRLTQAGSLNETLQAQVRAANDERDEAQANLRAATDQIKTMAVRLNLDPATVAPPATAPAAEAPAADTPAATDTPPAAGQDAGTAEGQTSGNPDGQESSDAPGEASGAYTVLHKGAGRYAVYKGDAQVTEPMARDEAEAKAAQLAATDAAMAPGAASATLAEAQARDEAETAAKTAARAADA